MFRETFTTPYKQHRDRAGQPFDVVRIIDRPDAIHDTEALPMYRIVFRDGVEIDAWPEEVVVANPSAVPNSSGGAA